MRAVVTGAAGFVGSHLCAHLLACGDEVVGIDLLTDYYDPALKERNLTPLRNFDAFSFHRVDLLDTPLPLLLEGAEVIYHLAGQPGVRSSWDRDFPCTSPATCWPLTRYWKLPGVGRCARWSSLPAPRCTVRSRPPHRRDTAAAAGFALRGDEVDG